MESCSHLYDIVFSTAVDHSVRDTPAVKKERGLQ